MIKVIVPNKKYNERYFGVQFVDGVAIFEDEKEGKAIADRLGYEVVEEKKVPTKTKPKAPVKKAPAKKADKGKE